MWVLLNQTTCHSRVCIRIAETRTPDYSLIMPNTVAKQLSIALNEITSEEQDSIEIEL